MKKGMECWCRRGMDHRGVRGWSVGEEEEWRSSSFVITYAVTLGPDQSLKEIQRLNPHMGLPS